MPPIRHSNVLNWASDVDPRAIEQAQRASRLPFIAAPVALMPDAHVGKGATVGSVIASQGAVIPAAVGVDLGCGMIALETNRTSTSLPDNLDELHHRIRTAIPAGVGKGHEDQKANIFDLIGQPTGTELTQKLESSIYKQFGSLGAGNHFVELCLDERDHVWLVLHSGSRGAGNQLASRHIDIAKGLMKQWFINLEDPDLAYLVQGTPEFDAYIADMLWAQRYAMANRQRMMDLAVVAFRETLGEFGVVQGINCHHNFTEMEHHHGKDVWVTRKGAIRARIGDKGVIPGSMGTRSYIVSGLGSAASLTSCSHGAGRRLSRGEARRTLDVDGFVASMVGKVWDRDAAEELIDEDPRAYKDIDQVMEDQRDLVTIEHTLRQILNYKGANDGPRRHV